MTTQPLLGLSGYARSGKDSLGAALGKYGFVKASFAAKLKELALRVDPFVQNQPHLREEVRLSEVIAKVGEETAKDRPEVRRFYQALGTEARAVLGPDVWVKAAMASLPDGPVVFTDVRFPNEAEAIVAAGGKIVRVERPGFAPINAHISETAMDDWPFDRTVVNAFGLPDIEPIALGLVSGFFPELVAACATT